LWRMQHAHLGFTPEHVMLISAPIRGTKMANAGREALTAEMLADIRRLPGTIAAAWAECTPLTGGSSSTLFTHSDRPLPRPWDRGKTIAGCAVGPDYFEAAGVRLLRGRAFTAPDFDHPQTLAILNETAVRVYFPGEDPIGRQIGGGRAGGWKTVVGVVADSKNQGLNQPPAPQMFLNDHVLDPSGDMAFVVRSAAANSILIDAVRAKLRTLDPGMLAKFETLDDAIGRMSSGSRFNTVLIGSFATLAFLMAVIGVYGVLSFAIAQRKQEIGIRMALGAAPARVQAMVLREGAALVSIGALVGLAGALLAGRQFLKPLLYDTSATDWRTYAAVAAAIAISAMLAAWLPAKRAATVDPATALKE